MCHLKSNTDALETSEFWGGGIQTFKMTLSDSCKLTNEACCYGGVLTGELLKETEEEGFTFVTQNVTHTTH